MKIINMTADEIIKIKIDDIADFPEQQEIYGDIILENEFIASIKDRGVITPLIVCVNAEVGIESDKKYTSISGHRRKYAAKHLNCTDVPCYVRHYDNVDEARLEFLSCNMQREKNNKIRLNEFKTFKQIISQMQKVYKKSSSYENTIFENKAFSRIWKDHHLDDIFADDTPVDTIQILKDITGYTKYEQEYLNVLFNDDWLQRKLLELRTRGANIQLENQLIALRENAAADYESEKCTLNQAVKAVKDAFNETLNSLEKPKKKVKPAPKPVLHEPQEQDNLDNLCSPVEDSEKFNLIFQNETNSIHCNNDFPFGGSNNFELVIKTQSGKAYQIDLNILCKLYNAFINETFEAA